MLKRIGTGVLVGIAALVCAGSAQASEVSIRVTDVMTYLDGDTFGLGDVGVGDGALDGFTIEQHKLAETSGPRSLIALDAQTKPLPGMSGWQLGEGSTYNALTSSDLLDGAQPGPLSTLKLEAWPGDARQVEIDGLEVDPFDYVSLYGSTIVKVPPENAWSPFSINVWGLDPVGKDMLLQVHGRIKTTTPVPPNPHDGGH